MDIIECIIKSDPKVVDRIISISEKCANDSCFTSSDRDYYQELHDGLAIASDDLNEYKNNHSKFPKLQESGSLLSQSTNPEILKVYIFAEIFFGRFRNNSKLLILDQADNEYLKGNIIEGLNDPLKSGNYFDYHTTPVIAFSLYGVEKMTFMWQDPMVFCEEGIAFELNNSRFNVVPYSNVNKVYVKEKKSFLSSHYDVWLLNGTNEPKESSLSGECSAKIDLHHYDNKEAITRSIYYFIKCFNPNCEYVKK